MRKARTEVVILGEGSDCAFGASKGRGVWYTSVGAVLSLVASRNALYLSLRGSVTMLLLLF